MTFGRRLIQLIKPLIWRFPRLSMAYWLLRDSRIFSGEPKPTPMGFKLVGNQAMEKGIFEPVETRLMETLLKGTDVFINVGANIGYYCCIALSRGVHTVAFEPIESNVRLLYKNVDANGWRNDIEVFPLALAEASGLREIYGGNTWASLIKGFSATSETYKSVVPVSTLDIVLGDRYAGKKCLILVDIEGAEYHMLQGAKKILCQQPKPVWMVEIASTDHQPKGLAVNPNLLCTFQLFWENGYVAWTATSEPRKVTPTEIEAACSNRANIFGIHNFLFLELPPAGSDCFARRQ